MWEERVDRLVRAGMIFIAGYTACASVNHVQKLWSEHGQLQVIQTKVAPKLKAQAAEVPTLKAEAGCEHWRAKVTEQLAKQAIIGANSDDATIPDAKAIPADHCQDIAKK